MAIKIKGTTILDDDRNLLSGNTITSSSFVGPLTGNASSATTLTGLTASIAELNFVDGVTSNIQTQLNGKLDLSGGTLTGDLTVPDKIIHSGDTDTAIRFPAADTVTIETAGSERLRVSSNGNVGIGTSSPNEKLTISEGNFNVVKTSGSPSFIVSSVQAAGYAPAFVRFNRVGAGLTATPDNSAVGRMRFDGRDLNGAYANFASIDVNIGANAAGGAPATLTFSVAPEGATVTERMRITSTGDVGIGTNNPSAKLDVNGSIQSNGSLISSQTFPNIRLFETDTTDLNTQLLNQDGEFRIQSLTDAGVASTRMYVNHSNGFAYFLNNVYIGPTSGGFPLNIETNGNAALQLTSNDRTASQIRFGDPDDSDQGYILYSHSSDSMIFQVNNAVRLSIASNGTSTFNHPINIAEDGENIRIGYGSSAGVNPYIGFYSGTTRRGYIQCFSDGDVRIRSDSGGAQIDIESDGAINIDPNTNFNVNGGNTVAGGFTITSTGFADLYRNSSTSTVIAFAIASNWGATDRVVFRVRADGNVQNYNNSYGAISDATLKENIVAATPKLDNLNKIRIVNFNFKGDTNKQLGVIAQEVEEVFPGLVDQDQDGIKSVKYSVFVPMLIKALQEQQQQIEELKQIVNGLKEQL